MVTPPIRPALLAVAGSLLIARLSGDAAANPVPSPDTLARWSWEAGDMEQAARRYAEMVPSSGVNYYLLPLGRCYQRLGRTDAAIRALEGFLQWESTQKPHWHEPWSDNQLRRDVEARLAELRRVAAAPATPPPSDVRVTPGAAGGAECARTGARIDFEGPLSRVEVLRGVGLGFSAPARDTTRAWCGEAALRVDVDFSDADHQAGELFVAAPEPVDLTKRVLTVRVFVEGPARATFDAQVASYREGLLIGGTRATSLRTGRWLTLRHRFGAHNTAQNGWKTAVDGVEGVVIQLWPHGRGAGLSWKGTLFVDDIDWR